MRTITIERSVSPSGNVQRTILIDGAKTQVYWTPEIAIDAQKRHQLNIEAEIMSAVLMELQLGYSLSEEERAKLVHLMSTTKE